MSKTFFSVSFSLLIFIGCYTAQSQKLEIGGGLGPTFYKGDIQPTFRPFNPRIGGNVFTRYNFSKSISFKANAFIGFVHGNDKRSGNQLNEKRDFRFKNTLWDYNAQVEYNFLNFRTHNGRYESNWTPYLFGGYGMYQLLKKKLISPTAESIEKKLSPNNIFLYGIGFKKILRGKLNIGAEFGTRVLLNKKYNDSFDGYGYESNKITTGYQRSVSGILNYPNTLQRDKYFYANFTISYLFYKVHCPPGSK